MVTLRKREGQLYLSLIQRHFLPHQTTPLLSENILDGQLAPEI
jgi:hypothetical protein